MQPLNINIHQINKHMNTQKHTPTPWMISKEIEYDVDSSDIVSENKKILSVYGYKFWGLTVEESKANARRIVACVNACSEMEDPKKDIFEMNLAIVKGLKTIEDRTKDIIYLKAENENQEYQINQLKKSNKYLTTGLILAITIAAGAFLTKYLVNIGVL